jgi:murein tripeptide amidase MpaA
MHAEYPNVTEVFTLGYSFESRIIKGIKITKNENNPILFIDANIHAREWIASASAVWLIHELLTSQDPNVRELVDGLTWIIIPLLNPDGYIYSQQVDRAWRKTRSTHASMLCTGADPNRNFEYNFMSKWHLEFKC